MVRAGVVIQLQTPLPRTKIKDGPHLVNVRRGLDIKFGLHAQLAVDLEERSTKGKPLKISDTLEAFRTWDFLSTEERPPRRLLSWIRLDAASLSFLRPSALSACGRGATAGGASSCSSVVLRETKYEQWVRRLCFHPQPFFSSNCTHMRPQQ